MKYISHSLIASEQGWCCVYYKHHHLRNFYNISLKTIENNNGLYQLYHK